MVSYDSGTEASGLSNEGKSIPDPVDPSSTSNYQVMLDFLKVVERQDLHR